MIRAKNFILQ